MINVNRFSPPPPPLPTPPSPPRPPHMSYMICVALIQFDSIHFTSIISFLKLLQYAIILSEHTQTTQQQHKTDEEKM